MRIRRSLVGGLVAALLLAGLPAASAAADGAQLSIGDAVVSEPANKSGSVTVDVPVAVHGAAAGAVSVGWRTVAGSAGSSDFVQASGTLAIAAGAPGGLIAVQVRADRTGEGAESFSIELTTASGAGVADGLGTVTIRPPINGLALGDVALTEPDAGSLQVSVAATLGGPPNKAVTFGWQLRSASGTVGQDAPAASGSATIPKGSMGTVVRFAVSGDTTVEEDETLELVVTSVSNASLVDAVGLVTLRNTDVPPPPPPPPADPFGWQPPADVLAGDTSILYVESPAGDFIGRGETYRYTKADSVMRIANKPNRFDLFVEGDESWTLSIAEPLSFTAIQPGYWENVGRYPFFMPGLSFSGEGRGCNTLVGRFIVDSILYFGDQIDQLTARFEQRCEGSGPPLLGYLRWARTDPTVPPPPGDPADFAWSPPAGVLPSTGSYLYFESSPGDFIGQGRTELYTEADSTFVYDAGGTFVQLFVDAPGTPNFDWSVNLAGRDNQAQLTTGLYEDVQRFPFHNPAKGGLDFSGEGRGCNTLSGSFAIDEITWDGVEPVSWSARFVQRCEGTGPPLFGAARWVRP